MAYNCCGGTAVSSVIMTATPKRRRFQFSLKAMLLVTTLVCLAFAWLAYERNEVRKREADIAAIEKLGCLIEFDCTQPFRPKWLRPFLGDKSTGEVDTVIFYRGNVTDADLVHIEGMTKIKRLDIHGQQVTDAGLARLAALRNLELLDLHGSQITDAGLAHLAGQKKLNRLYLYDTKITDAGVAHLAGLSELKHLDLSRTETTDAGLEQLAGLGELQSLYLYNNRVTDAGISHLAGNRKLDLLYLYNTQVTDQGIDELKKSLPNVRIKR